LAGLDNYEVVSICLTFDFHIWLKQKIIKVAAETGGSIGRGQNIQIINCL